MTVILWNHWIYADMCYFVTLSFKVKNCFAICHFHLLSHIDLPLVINIFLFEYLGGLNV